MKWTINAIRTIKRQLNLDFEAMNALWLDLTILIIKTVDIRHFLRARIGDGDGSGYLSKIESSLRQI